MAAISDKKVVTITYDLSVTDENQEKVLVESAEADAPMVFLFGHSGLPEEFEAQLDGKNPGDEFQFSLTPSRPTASTTTQALVEIPKEVFLIDGKLDEEMLQPGNFLPMADNEGNHMQAKVISIGDTAVQMDFNHPLAGMVMHFHRQSGRKCAKPPPTSWPTATPTAKAATSTNSHRPARAADYQHPLVGLPMAGRSRYFWRACEAAGRRSTAVLWQ